MADTSDILYRACRALLRAALGFYFSRIEKFHSEQVPVSGPILFASNHPNSLTDAFVIGASVYRKVSFVATVQLFRFAPLRWLLLQCGVIPINRVKDDPRAMRSVLATFEACFEVLERGEAIAIFPEGITHDDPQLKTVKTGAARMALELEHRHQGKLGLYIVPVGLSFSAKDRYRSEVLVNFGEPIRVADWCAGYSERKHESIQALNLELENRIQHQMLHLPQLERAHLVEAVKGLYLEKLRLGNTVIHEPMGRLSEQLVLTQTIAKAVDFCCEQHPERATAFARELRHYESAVRKLRIPEDLLGAPASTSRLLWSTGLKALVAISGAPIAFIGWLHRLVPVLLIEKVVKRSQKLPRDRTHVSTATIVSGVVLFSVFYGSLVLLCRYWFGGRIALIYALTLPFISVAAHYYLLHLRKLFGSIRVLAILLRTPAAIPKLLAWRAHLIEQIEVERSALSQTSFSSV